MRIQPSLDIQEKFFDSLLELLEPQTHSVTFCNPNLPRVASSFWSTKQAAASTLAWDCSMTGEPPRYMLRGAAFSRSAAQLPMCSPPAQLHLPRCAGKEGASTSAAAASAATDQAAMAEAAAQQAVAQQAAEQPAASKAKAVEGEEDDDDDENETCGFCRFMKGGGCRTAFTVSRCMSRCWLCRHGWLSTLCTPDLQREVHTVSKVHLPIHQLM